MFVLGLRATFFKKVDVKCHLLLRKTKIITKAVRSRTKIEVISKPCVEVEDATFNLTKSVIGFSENKLSYGHFADFIVPNIAAAIQVTNCDLQWPVLSP